jgi:hypothetical protein
MMGGVKDNNQQSGKSICINWSSLSESVKSCRHASPEFTLDIIFSHGMVPFQHTNMNNIERKKTQANDKY